MITLTACKFLAVNGSISVVNTAAPPPFAGVVGGVPAAAPAISAALSRDGIANLIIQKEYEKRIPEIHYICAAFVANH